jgi:Asp-tRNA(Asn)/Glu-tRNA(Gln) amidotransferase A subunit family amidase
VNIMHDLHFLELAALAELIRTRAISPVEITAHQLDRSRARRPNRMMRSLATAATSSRGESKNGNRIEGRSL